MGRRQVRELIQSERARGTTVLFCTHIISDVESLCDRVAIVDHGHVIALGRDNSAGAPERYDPNAEQARG